MKTYLICAAGAIFLSIIVTLLVPEGKLHKTITFAMRIVCIFVLIQPVTAIFDFDLKSESSELIDYAFIENTYSAHQSAQLENLLNEEFGGDWKCNVNVNYSGDEFSVDYVAVEAEENNEKLFEEIEAYLRGLGYINITVYATRT